MIKRGCDVCDVTSTAPKRVRNDSFYKEIMTWVQEKLKSYDEDEFFNGDPFADECLDLDI